MYKCQGIFWGQREQVRHHFPRFYKLKWLDIRCPQVDEIPHRYLGDFIPHGMPGMVAKFSAETYMVMGGWTNAVGSLSQASSLSQCCVRFQTSACLLFNSNK